MDYNPIGGALAGPPPTVKTPPKDEQEMQQRKQGWQQMLQNPATQAALLQFGINLSQPRSLGQSGMGHLTSAIGAGMGAAGRVEENQRKRQMEDAAAQMENRKVTAQERGVDIQGRQADTAARQGDARIGLEGDRVALEERNVDSQIANREQMYRAQMAQLGMQRKELKIKQMTANSTIEANKIANDLKKLEQTEKEMQLDFMKELQTTDPQRFKDVMAPVPQVTGGDKGPLTTTAILADAQKQATTQAATTFDPEEQKRIYDEVFASRIRQYIQLLQSQGRLAEAAQLEGTLLPGATPPTAMDFKSEAEAIQWLNTQPAGTYNFTINGKKIDKPVVKQ